MMANMVKNVLAKFNYGRLRIDKVLGNFRKHDNNNKSKNKKNSVGGDGDPFRVQKGFKRLRQQLQRRRFAAFTRGKKLEGTRKEKHGSASNNPSHENRQISAIDSNAAV